MSEEFDLDAAIETAVGEVVDEEAEEQAAQGAADGPSVAANAEIILLLTSLGSVRRQYFASKRAKHFLDCKGVVYYIIDTNKDVTQGAELSDIELLDRWKDKNILMRDKKLYEDSILIPQVLVDGVPLGDEAAIQDLEEDGDLDWIFARAACPACLCDKDPEANRCSSCGVALRTLLPEDAVYSGQVQQIFKGLNYGAFGEGEVFEHPVFQTVAGDASHGSGNYSYEDLFGEPPPG